MFVITFDSLGLILFATVFLSMLLVPIASYWAHEIGAIDTPKGRSSHATPMPRVGGLAMSLSLAIACVVYLPWDTFLFAFLSGLAVIVITGVIDDIWEISPRWKFLGQIIAASLFVYLSGMKIDHLGDLAGVGNIELGNASFAITVFCIVGGMNAFNLSDGLDGLAGGLAVIAAVFFGSLAWGVNSGGLLIIAVSLIGAIIGFLHYNSHPAKVFMGDSGSLMLGYVLAVLLVGLTNFSAAIPVSTLAMFVALPLLDTLLVMARRLRYGHSPFMPDRTHLHHRLMDIGLPHSAVVVVLYCAMLSFGFLAILLRQQPEWVIFVSIFAFGLVIFSIISGLQHFGFRYTETEESRYTFQQTTLFRRIAYWLIVSAKPIGMGAVVLLVIPALFAPLFELTVGKVTSLFSISGLLLFFGLKEQVSNKSILHGALYLAIFTLILTYEVSVLHHPSWLGRYMDDLAAVVLFWVVLKLFFTSHRQIMFASGFELLVLFVSWFIPFVLMDELHIWKPLVSAVQHACLLTIPFMLAMKINIRNYGKEQRWITLPLFFALAVAGLRSLV